MRAEALVRVLNRQPAVIRWGIALLFFGAALGARVALFPGTTGLPFLTFFPAIFGAALLCGWAPAVGITGLTVAAALVLFVPRGLGSAAGQAHSAVVVALFVAICLLDIFIVTALLNTIRVNQRLLRQQEVMFRELQHRVANSLQFVATMLALARKDVAGAEDAGAVLESAAARIQAMGQLHRKLHDAASYEDGLAPVLSAVLADVFTGLEVATTIEAPVALPLSQMTPAVLLITEAATNSAKYVFRPRQGGRFFVSLRARGDAAELAVWDDGPGVEPDAVPGLGTRIMDGLARQLGGRLDRKPGPGARIEVAFSRA